MSYLLVPLRMTRNSLGNDSIFKILEQLLVTQHMMQFQLSMLNHYHMRYYEQFFLAFVIVAVLPSLFVMLCFKKCPKRKVLNVTCV